MTFMYELIPHLNGPFIGLHSPQFPLDDLLRGRVRGKVYMLFQAYVIPS